MGVEEKEFVSIIAEAALDKKARDLVVLDLAGLSPVCDYFVICSGNSNTQVKAIAEHVKSKMKENGHEALRVEGIKDAHWILMDYGIVVVHVFQDEDRDFYNLERLWGDARVVELPV